MNYERVYKRKLERGEIESGFERFMKKRKGDGANVEL